MQAKLEIEQSVHVKSWVKTVLGKEDVNKEIYETMRDCIASSGLKKLPRKKSCEKDIALLKHASTYEMKTCDLLTAVPSHIEPAVGGPSVSLNHRPS